MFAFFLPKRNIEEGESLSALLICVELTESRNCSFAARRPRSSNFPFYGDYSSIACDRIAKETSWNAGGCSFDGGESVEESVDFHGFIYNRW